ncbi:hypothetical protein D3C75_1101390 [compost metagenome]
MVVIAAWIAALHIADQLLEGVAQHQGPHGVGRVAQLVVQDLGGFVHRVLAGLEGVLLDHPGGDQIGDGAGGGNGQCNQQHEGGPDALLEGKLVQHVPRRCRFYSVRMLPQPHHPP